MNILLWYNFKIYIYLNYNRDTISNQQKKTYGSNTNQPNNYNRGNKVNIVRTTQSYSRGGNYGSGSQFRGRRNHSREVTTEKRVYNSNAFFNNNK